MKQPLVVILSGATATGKTTLAVALAQKYQLQIINFDSLLFYRELNIGTAKPSPQQLAQAPHHLIGIRSIKDPMSAADFCHLALAQIHSSHQQGIIPLLVGGSAFYLRALLQGMYPSKTLSPDIRHRSRALYQQQGIEPFRQLLLQHDPSHFHSLHPNDHYRIRRAVEHYWSTGQPFTSARQQWENSPRRHHSNIHSWNLCHLYLVMEKHRHWEAIAQRSKQMVDNGLLDEVSGLFQQGFSGEERPLRSIGYRQARQYLSHPLPTLDQLVEQISINTRQLAKAQKTFFATIAPKQSFELQKHQQPGREIAAYLQCFLVQQGHLAPC